MPITEHTCLAAKCVLQLAAAGNLKTRGSLSANQWNAASAQVQGIEEVSWVSVIGITGMVWALAVVAVKLCLTPKMANYVPTVLFPRVSFAGIPDMLVAVFDTVFTFGGQVNWVRCEPLSPNIYAHFGACNRAGHWTHSLTYSVRMLQRKSLSAQASVQHCRAPEEAASAEKSLRMLQVFDVDEVQEEVPHRCGKCDCGHGGYAAPLPPRAFSFPDVPCAYITLLRPTRAWAAFGFLRVLPPILPVDEGTRQREFLACAVMYIMIGCVGYYRLGSDFDKSKPVTSVLPQDIWTSLANVGLLAHCIIAYMVLSSYLACSTGVLDAQSICQTCMLWSDSCSMHISECLERDLSARVLRPAGQIMRGWRPLGWLFSAALG